MKTERKDIYQEVTDKIVAALEAGTMPWLRPWKQTGSGSLILGVQPYNAATGRPYNGINTLILGLSSYSDLGWLTFKQAKELGGSVRKGEKGTHIIYWTFKDKKDPDTGETKKVPFIREYVVFNVQQCDEIITEKLKRPEPPKPGETDMNKIAEKLNINLKHGGERAFYSPMGDFIMMPSVKDFKDENNYQATLAHEMTHWTGHKSRCNRDFLNRFGSEAYAFEELVAEIGSAFLCAEKGIPLEGLQHTNYIGSWLKTLKDDKRAIFTASSQAKKAVDFINGKKEPEEAQESLSLAA